MNKINKLLLSLLVSIPIYSNAIAATPETRELNSDVKADSNNKYTPSVIKKIDKENGKITLKHENIKSLDMPAMTMVFKLKLADTNTLDILKVGDNVKAVFGKTNDGFIVTEIFKYE